jgi:hypothetical protein
LYYTVWNVYGSVSLVNTYNSQYGLYFNEINSVNQYSSMTINAYYAVYINDPLIWNQYGNLSISSTYAAIYCSGPATVEWKQFGSVSITITNGYYGIYLEEITWVQLGDVTINSPSPGGVSTRYGIYSSTYVEWIQNGTVTITGSYSNNDGVLYLSDETSWLQTGMVNVTASENTYGIYVYYSDWQQDGEVYVDASPAGATGIYLEETSWVSNNNSYITLSNQSAVGIYVYSDSVWSTGYIPIFTGGSPGNLVQCSSDSTIASLPTALGADNTDGTCEITYLPELTIGQPQVVSYSSGGKTANFNVVATLSQPAPVAFTAGAVVSGSLASLVGLSGNGFSFAAGATTATLYGNATFTDTVFYCGGSASLTVAPSDQYYVIGPNNTFALTFPQSTPSSANKLVASLATRALAFFL